MNVTTVSLRQTDVARALAALQKPVPAVQMSRRLRVLAISTILLGALAVGVFGIAPKAAGEPEQVPQKLARSVSVVSPQRGNARRELLLPAEVHAYQTTSIHARIGGYLKAWYVDRGARVQAGQVLAEIDAPEFDQELQRARADLDEGQALLEQARAESDQAKANLAASRANVLKAQASLKLAAITEERYKNLEEKWAATRQQYDESVRTHEEAKAELTATQANVGSFEAAAATREAAIRTDEARLNSLRATVRRLEQWEGFKRLTAPFAGVITKRSADVGALVPADGSRELFTLAQDDTLRVIANVPQAFAASVAEGQSAEVVSREFAAEAFKGRVARTSGAIDSGARTLAVEVELANPERKLLPGSFAQVRFLLQDAGAGLRIPSSTLRFTKAGALVLSVDALGRMQPLGIKLGRDYGAQVEVLAGLVGGERLVVNPADGMAQGEQVNVVDE